MNVSFQYYIYSITYFFLCRICSTIGFMIGLQCAVEYIYEYVSVTEEILYTIQKSRENKVRILTHIVQTDSTREKKNDAHFLLPSTLKRALMV